MVGPEVRITLGDVVPGLFESGSYDVSSVASVVSNESIATGRGADIPEPAISRATIIGTIQDVIRHVPAGSIVREHLDPRWREPMIRDTRLLRVVFLAAAFFAAGCRATPAVTSGSSGADPKVASAAPATSPPDTAFVELGRFEERGTPNGRGGCTWGATRVPHPGDTLTGVQHEVHGISVDTRECTRLDAYGYRRAPVPIDTAGGASASRAVTVTFDSLGKPRRP